MITFFKNFFCYSFYKMVTASERVNSIQLYKDNYYVSGIIMFCKFCNITIDHKNKSKVDQHLNTKKHKNNKTAIERRNIQVNNKQNTISEKDELNLELVKVFYCSNIPFEKVDKLKPFFRKYCKNGMLNLSK